MPVKGDRVEYYPTDYARNKFRGSVSLNNYTKIIRDPDGTARPLPQAYDNIPVRLAHIPPKPRKSAILSGGDAGRTRVQIQTIQRQDDLGRTRPKQSKCLVSNASRTAPQALCWNNPDKAGENLPTLSITMKSSNSRGSRTIGVWPNDPLVGGRLPSALAEQYGPENVAVKDKNNISRTSTL